VGPTFYYNNVCTIQSKPALEKGKNVQSKAVE